MTEVEMCWRCPTPMAFVHGTWQCPRCKFKLGCCEGDPQTPCDAAPSITRSGDAERTASAGSGDASREWL